MPKEKTHHVPAEMSDETLRSYYPELGAGTVRLPLEDLYPLLGRLSQALKTDPGHNPDGLTIDDLGQFWGYTYPLDALANWEYPSTRSANWEYPRFRQS
jgi:hypothetical protein